MMGKGAAGAKVLIVEDSKVMVEMIRSYLAPMGILQPMIALTSLEAIEMFENNRPDIVLLDAVLPDLDGFETARRMRALEREGEWSAIIFITSQTSDEHLARGIECGGDDYLLKPVSQVVLNSKVRAMQRLIQMQRSLLSVTHNLAAANRELQHLSMTDALTGIANRRFFDEMSLREWRRCGRMQRAMSLIMIDVDHFKAYNDTHGHQQGDECLKQVATQVAHAATRAGDMAARYGGEEFGLILGETDTDGALWVGNLVRQRVLDLKLPHTGSEFGYVTASCGVTSVMPGPDKSLEILLQSADRALYLAKEQGRNRTVFVPYGETGQDP